MLRKILLGLTWAATLYLVFTFTFVGTCKLGPWLDAGVHAYLVDGAKQYWGNVFSPFFSKVGVAVSGSDLRVIIGASEVAGAAGLLIGSLFGISLIHVAANVGLIYIMIGAVYFHVATNTDVTQAATVLGALVLRLFLILITPSAPKQKAKTN